MAEGTVPRGPCSPAGSIGEHDIAVLICALQEGDTGVLLPVPHGLPEDCPLAACQDKGGQAVTVVQVGPLPPIAKESAIHWTDRQKVPLTPSCRTGLS